MCLSVRECERGGGGKTYDEQNPSSERHKSQNTKTCVYVYMYYYFLQWRTAKRMWGQLNRIGI